MRKKNGLRLHNKERNIEKLGDALAQIPKENRKVIQTEVLLPKLSSKA